MFSEAVQRQRWADTGRVFQEAGSEEQKACDCEPNLTVWALCQELEIISSWERGATSDSKTHKKSNQIKKCFILSCSTNAGLYRWNHDKHNVYYLQKVLSQII